MIGEVVFLPAVDGSDRVSAEFLRLLVKLCRRQRLDPGWLLAVMSIETGHTFSPAVRNKQSGATGLIQFMPQTARSLGTTVEQLASMSAESQLMYVERFFAPHRKRDLAARRPVDTYLAVFSPEHIGDSFASVLYREPTKAYRQNKAFDVDEKGTITVADVDRVIQRALKRAGTREPLRVVVVADEVGVGVALLGLAGAAALAYVGRDR